MPSLWCRRSLALLLTSATAAAAPLAGCGDDEVPDGPDECSPEATLAAALAQRSRPAGIAPGEPYRWLTRSWTSPLGLTFRTYGLAIDGIAVHARRQIEVYDGRGQLVHRAGTGDQVLAALRAPAKGASATASATATPRRFHHPLAAAAAIPRAAPPHPLRRDEEHPVWFYAGDGELRPAIASERLNLVGDQVGDSPLGEVTLRDATSGAELARSRTIFDLEDPEYLVYAREDGRPLTSPLGDIYPHPSGAPDGQVPGLVSQRLIRQSAALHARPEPWLAAGQDQTRGNNVVAFFNSLIDADGKIADLYGADDLATPEYGPLPDELGNDFFAKAQSRRFAFPYDASAAATMREYFQTEPPGEPASPPTEKDPIHAKIVQAFYTTNWLHDFFYTAGFDELAGNAQQDNSGRGGLACDPLIVHSAFFTTFTYPGTEGISPVLDLGLNSRSTSMRDANMDASITAHEWGHYMIGRLAGSTGPTDGMGNLQGRSLHEGIADFIAVLIGLDAGDDLRGAFPVGSYYNLNYREPRNPLPPAEAPADLFYGIRRFPYSMDLAKNPLTFKHLAEPPSLPYYNWKGRGPILSEVHTAGEIFGAALFQCFGNIVAANPAVPFEELRARMAKVLVAALVAFPEHPTFLEARDALLTVIKLATPADHAPCRAGFATRGLGQGARGPDRAFEAGDPPSRPYNAADIQESFVDAD